MAQNKLECLALDWVYVLSKSYNRISTRFSRFRDIYNGLPHWGNYTVGEVAIYEKSHACVFGEIYMIRIFMNIVLQIFRKNTSEFFH